VGFRRAARFSRSARIRAISSGAGISSIMARLRLRTILNLRASRE
jgi:hypothetical protein